jgi:dolichyl-phosphate-mannose-protein mannosyltransferase
MNLNLGLQINKKDILTMVLLSIVFLSIATVNLGATNVPINSWQTNQDQTIQVDLGKPVYVQAVYLLVKNGSANIQFSSETQNSSQISPIKIEYPVYYVWKNTTINAQTRYVNISFEQANVEIIEIALTDQNNQQIPIATVTGEGFSDANLAKLTDEQSIVQVPQTYMTETMFDEIYFVRTAEQYLNIQSPYEWTHPPLGKIIIAIGIAAAGFNPFGWRIMGVIFAMLLIPLMYLLGKKLFGSWIGGFSAAFLFTFDFMHFSMARMGTADTYVVFFSVASQLFFLVYLSGVVKNGWKATSVVPLFLAFLFFAFGFSTKWLVLYGFVGQIAILATIRLYEVLKQKSKVSTKVYDFFEHPYSYIVAFVLMAIGIYFLTYIPDMLAGRSFIDVVGLQGGMYSYHSGLTATHPFSSAWWSWPLISRPVWLYVSYLPNQMKSTITLMGNPAVWWVGFAAIIGITGIFLAKTLPALKKRVIPKLDLPIAFIVVLFFFQWLPYVTITRALFIYHFYVNVPFLCLGSAYFINKYWKYKWMKVAAIAYFGVVVAVFVLFYPVISGAPTTASTVESLRWFEGWIF